MNTSVGKAGSSLASKRWGRRSRARPDCSFACLGRSERTANWSDLMKSRIPSKSTKQIEAVSGRLSPATVWRTAEEAVVAGDVATLDALLRDYGDIIRNERPQS